MQSAIATSHRQEVLRRVVLFGTPLLLGILELGHPLLDHMNPIRMLAPIATWWIILHLLLVPLFALMGWTLFLLLQGIQNRDATLCRYATVIYMSFTIGYDTLVGLNSGILASNALTLPCTASYRSGCDAPALHKSSHYPLLLHTLWIRDCRRLLSSMGTCPCWCTSFARFRFVRNDFVCLFPRDSVWAAWQCLFPLSCFMDRTGVAENASEGK